MVSPVVKIVYEVIRLLTRVQVSENLRSVKVRYLISRLSVCDYLYSLSFKTK